MKQKLLSGTCLRLVAIWLLAIVPLLSMQAQTTVNRQTVSVGDNVRTLKELIRHVEANSNYRFSYQPLLIEGVLVHIDVQSKPVMQVLDLALANTELTYTVKGNDIVIKKRLQTTQATQLRQQQSTNDAATEQRIVKGRVVDAITGEPIIGASIWVKDSTLGTNSDVNGNFLFAVSGLHSAVSISYVGYQVVETPITDVPMTIKLSTDQQIEDVVVVGYGVQKKASVIGSIASMPVDNLKIPTAGISSALAGNLAGVVAIQRSGEPGSGSTFWIRGVSSFSNQAYPLVLVDGIERNMDLVDMEDIKELSILKDAAATAIYGVRGANGVVLISTRSGEEGKPKISFKAETGIIQPTMVPEMVNSEQFATMYNQAVGYDYYPTEVIDAYRTGSDPDLYPNVDWMNSLYKNHAWNQRVNLSVSGGSSIAKFSYLAAITTSKASLLVII